MKTKIYFRFAQTLLFCVLFASGAFAQSGTLKGKITDSKTKAPIPFASVVLEKGGKQIAGAATDFNGEYTIKPIPPGTYDLRASFVGYTTVFIKGIVISPDKYVYQDISLEVSTTTLSCVVVKDYKVKLISKDQTTTGSTLTASDISKMPGRDAGSISFTSGGTFSTSETVGDIAIKGSRTEGVVTYIDGVKVIGSSSVPKSAIDSDDSKSSPKEDLTVINEPTAGAGILTAGELNDFGKWELWKDIAHTDLNTVQSEWNIYPMDRFTIQVMGINDKPVIDCEVNALNKENNILWTSRTDNTGKAEIWLNLFDQDEVKKEDISVRVNYHGKNHMLEKVSAFADGVNIMKIPVGCENPMVADILFAVDATGSMSDELDFLKAELNDITKVNNLYPAVKMNLGCVFYRDSGDEYITRKCDFSGDINKTVLFINKQYAGGGGDYEEAVDVAFNVAINEMKWSNNAAVRLMFVILDAPPHNFPDVRNSLQKSILAAAAKGIRIIPITASGINKSAEYLLRSIALATNGNYIFLTNHSNVGGYHITPTTDEFDVTYLNGLLLSLFYRYLYFVPCDNAPIIKGKDDKDTMYVYNPEVIDHVIVKPSTVKTKKELKQEQKLQQQEEKQQKEETPPNTNDPVYTPSNDTELSKFDLKYYPNPTSGNLTIEIEGNIAELYIADITGKLIEKYKINDQTRLQVNIEKYPSGIYFIQYPYKDKWLSGKIILQH
jgi:hypothetical protein